MQGLRWWLSVALVLAILPSMRWHAPQGRSCEVPQCLCRDCRSGGHCCCARQESGLGKLVALSQCDNAEKQAYSLRTVSRAVETPSILVPFPPLRFIGLQAIIQIPVSRFTSPREPPPRTLLSR